MKDKIMDDLTKILLSMQDFGYKAFQSKLIPDVASERIIGIRTPVLRKFAKEYIKTNKTEKFLSSLPHYYFEENNFHAFIIEQQKDYEETIKLLDRFLPYVDNWATCDGMSPSILKKNTDKLIKEIDKWLESSYTYQIRFAILCLMRYYLDDKFKPEYLYIVCNIKSVEYYINMMRAWYFATALAKQYKETIFILENKLLDTWTHNKAIQKSIESLRIDKSTKEYLKKLKIK